MGRSRRGYMNAKVWNTFLIATLFSGAFTAHASYDFAYYAHKTRKFIEYFGHASADTVPIKPIEQYEKRAGWTINAYRTKEGIFLNTDVLLTEAHGINLFTCAHEAAHWVFHDIHAKGYDIEQDADTKAAEMLCNNGYAWVVQEKINDLATMIEDGHGQTIDPNKPRPTVQTRHQYLSHILDSYLTAHPLQAHLLTIRTSCDTCVLAGSHLLVGISGLILGTTLKTTSLFTKSNS